MNTPLEVSVQEDYCLRTIGFNFRFREHDFREAVAAAHGPAGWHPRTIPDLSDAEGVLAQLLLIAKYITEQRVNPPTQTVVVREVSAPALPPSKQTTP
jgi:hypothetical protein